MKKCKTPILLLVTLLLLGITASLPNITAAIFDRATVDHVGYSEMKALELELSEEREYLPMMGKLAMFGDMQSVDIDPLQASMTEEDVLAAAESAMEAYVQAGIFAWFDATLCTAVPKLGIDASDTSRYFIYWTITYTNAYDPSRALTLDVDDETGKILCIRYEVYDSYTMKDVWKRNEAVMEQFTDIYFSQLGLTEAVAYARATEAGCTYYERDGGVSDAQYSFGDALYGEVNIGFCVEGAGGFYVVFPK